MGGAWLPGPNWVQSLAESLTNCLPWRRGSVCSGVYLTSLLCDFLIYKIDKVIAKGFVQENLNGLTLAKHLLAMLGI